MEYSRTLTPEETFQVRCLTPNSSPAHLNLRFRREEKEGSVSSFPFSHQFLCGLLSLNGRNRVLRKDYHVT